MSKCYEFATVYSDFGRTLHLECYVYIYNLNNLKSNKWTKKAKVKTRNLQFVCAQCSEKYM